MKQIMAMIALLIGLTTTQVVAHTGLDEEISSTVEVTVVRGDLSPSNISYTISRSGVYKLTSSKTASGVPNIVISADNVVLDLAGNTVTGGTNGIEITGSNVVIKNGTISGMSQIGILVQNRGCCIENCDIVGCLKGIFLGDGTSNVNKCIVYKCRIRECSALGIELDAIVDSMIKETQCVSLHGSGSVYGIYAKDVINTIIDGCQIHDIQTSSANGSDKVVGIANENNDPFFKNTLITNNTVVGVKSLTTIPAYGIWVNGGLNASITANTVSKVTTSNALGQGIFINQANSYVASNLCYACDLSFAGVGTSFITSQANARGVYNIDANLSTADDVETLVAYAACDPTPLTTNDISAQTIVLNSAGNYCLAQDLTTTVSLVADHVTLCLNDRNLFGRVEIYGDYALVKNGTVMLGGVGTEPVVALDSGAAQCTLSNLNVVALPASSGAGRNAVTIAGSNASVEGGTFKGGSAVSGVGGHGICCVSPCTRAHISGAFILGTGDGVGARAGNGIEIENGCSSIAIDHCRIAHTGDGTINGIAINDQHTQTLANYSSIINNNFAYDIANTSTVYELRNKGTGGITDGVNIISGTPGLYDNVYVQ